MVFTMQLGNVELEGPIVKKEWRGMKNESGTDILKYSTDSILKHSSHYHPCELQCINCFIYEQVHSSKIKIVKHKSSCFFFIKI